MSGTHFSPTGSEGRTAQAETRRLAARLAGVFLLLAALLVGVGAVYLSHQQAQARREVHRELSGIADLKLRQMLSWREERLSDAHFFAHAQFVARDVQALRAAPQSAAARAAVLHWLSLLKAGDRYHGVALFDAQGARLMALPETAGEPMALLAGDLEQVRQSHAVVMTDLHRDEANGFVHLDIVFPIFAEADWNAAAPMAFVLLKLDARHFLFPLLQSWPVPSPTAETLLVRREGNAVVYLNDLRHRAGTALALRLALSTPELPAAQVLRGDTQVLEGRDYRGVPVLAAGRLVPGTPWALVAKIDREEVYAPLRRQTLATLAVLGALLVAAALLVALLWRQRSAWFLERELAERKAHEQAMERLNRLYAALSQVNGAVVRSGSREELLREMCRALVQAGGFKMAWIGWVDPATRRVVPLAQCGDESAYLQHIEVYADERPQGQGPVGTAIRTARPCVCNDLLGDPHMQPFRAAALQAGWRSLAAFPIRQEGQVCGALAVYALQQEFFGAQEQALLEAAAGDASFGLDTLLNAQRRAQAEEQLRLRVAALQSAANAVVITDRQGIIEWVNTAFERLTGYPMAEAVGQTPRVLKSDRQPPGFFKTMWQTITAGRVWHGELVNKRKDGSLYYEEMTVTPVPDAQGAITHFIAIKQDVSERKQAEQALQEARDALAQANADLEQKVRERTTQLVEANSNLQTFAYTAAHDLRSPLRAIKGFSSLVLEDVGARLEAEDRTMLERVVGSADQMGRLLDDLLEYSKMSQADLKLGPLSLRQAVSEALALLEGDLRTKKAVVSVIEPLPVVIGHAATVVLLINNLVSNALKFMPAGVPPHIRIWAERRDGERGASERQSVGAWEREASEHAPRSTLHAPDAPHAPHAPHVRLWVEDNGIGIVPEHLPKLFVAFQRLQGKQAYPGTGLGLAIVRKGAERMGGQVGVESELGKGSRFWFELRAESALPQPTPAAA